MDTADSVDKSITRTDLAMGSITFTNMNLTFTYAEGTSPLSLRLQDLLVAVKLDGRGK